MTSRRALLGWITLVPGLGLAARPVLAAERSASFAPGATPYRLIRRVERELRDRTRLVVERTWTVRFVPVGHGYRVEGQQRAIDVIAPPSLDFLATIERERVEDGMFPALLDAHGRSVGGARASIDSSLAGAVSEVRARMDQWGDDAGWRDRADRFLARLQQDGAESLSAWPASLFAPGDMDMVEHRPVPLAEGLAGMIAVRTVTSSDPASGLLRHLERTVETRLESSIRVGLERFSLTPEI